MIDLVGLFLTIGFWVLFAYSLYAVEERRVPVICSIIWLIAFAAPYALPALYVPSIIVRYILPVVLAVWLKIRDML
jgi:hypothetical protein